MLHTEGGAFLEGSFRNYPCSMEPFKGSLISLQAKVNYTAVCLLFVVVGLASGYSVYRGGDSLLVAAAGVLLLSLGVVGIALAPKVWAGRYVIIDAEGFTLFVGGKPQWHVAWAELQNAYCLIQPRVRIFRVVGIPIPHRRRQASLDLFPAGSLDQFAARHPEMTEYVRGDHYRLPATDFGANRMPQLHESLRFFSGGKSPGVVEGELAIGGDYEF